MGIIISVESDRESPGKFDSRTLNRETLNRWTGRTYTYTCMSMSMINIHVYNLYVHMCVYAYNTYMCIYVYIYIYIYIHRFTYTRSGVWLARGDLNSAVISVHIPMPKIVRKTCL